MFPSGLFVIHDSARGGHHDVAELSRWQQVVGPLLNVPDADVEPGADHAAFVQPAGQVDHDFAPAVVVHDLELADVAVLHHDGQEADDHFAGGTQQDLPFAAFLGVVDGLQGRGQRVHQHHLDFMCVSVAKKSNDQLDINGYLIEN